MSSSGAYPSGTDVIAGWALEFEAVNEGGRLLHDLARAAVRIGGIGRDCVANLLFEAGCCAKCGLFEVATTPISIRGSAIGAVIRERILDLSDLSNYMSYQEVADYIAAHYGVVVSENTIANVVSASMDRMDGQISMIVERIRANGYAVVDEAMARAMGRWGYIVVACSGGAVLITTATSRSQPALEESLGEVWDVPMVTDEHGAYRKKKDRQSDHVHYLRFAEEPVYVWLTMFGEFAGEAGIDPRAEFRRVEAAVVPPLVDMIESSPGVRLVDGAVLPSVKPTGGGGGDAAAAVPLPLPFPSAAASASASAPPPPPPSPAAGRRPTPGEIAAYHRDVNTYFARLSFYNVVKHIDTAPPEMALALQRVLYGILDGYGDQHPVKTRYENAMPWLFYYLQVAGMPPHSNDAEKTVRNVAKRYMDAHVQFKSVRGMDVGSKKMTITTNARNHGMTVGRAVTYALADPSWCILDGPPKKPPPWLPPGGARGGPG